MTSPYDYTTQNRYAIRVAGTPEIMQCSVAFIRSQHNEVEAVVTDWDNNDHPKVRLAGPAAPATGTTTATLKGLPFDLVVKSTGAYKTTPMEFTYGVSGKHSYFKWNSKSTGAGRGPNGALGKNNDFCKVELKKADYDPANYPNVATATLGMKTSAGYPAPKLPAAKQQEVEYTKCWFPCFEQAI